MSSASPGPNPNECNSTRTSVLGVFSSNFGLRHFAFRRDQKFSPSDNHSKTREWRGRTLGADLHCTRIDIFSLARVFFSDGDLNKSVSHTEKN